MADLASAVHGAVGQPASVRVGTVDSVSPLRISAQGVPFNEVGVLGNYAPQVGDAVVMLGQSSWVGSDPASWLALGRVQASSVAGIQTRRVLDGSIVGAVTLASAVSAETNLAQLALTAPVVQGGAYIFKVQLRVTVTDPTDDWDLNLRRDTALTGTVIGRAQFSGSNLIDSFHFELAYVAPTTGTVDFYFSVVRTAGAGTITVLGSPGASITRTWSAVEEAGYSTGFGGVWRENVV